MWEMVEAVVASFSSGIYSTSASKVLHDAIEPLHKLVPMGGVEVVKRGVIAARIGGFFRRA